MSSKAKIYLYKEGNQCVSLTGGWGDTHGLESNLSRIKAVYENNRMHVKSSVSNGEVRFGIAKSINLSSFSNLCTDIDNKKAYIELTLINAVRLLTNISDVTSYKYKRITQTGRFTDSLDISDVNLSRYIGYSYSDKKATGEVGYYIYNVYLETKDNIISINSQNNSSINFSCNNLDNLISITKAEVYINNKLSKTYTSNFDSITYNIDNSLCVIGENNISVRVTYSQGDDIYETVEEVLTHTNTVNNLSTSSSLKELIDRQELLTNAIEVQKNTLKSILESKNVVVSEGENKLSILIDKVNDLENPIKWIYKDGVELVQLDGQAYVNPTYWTTKKQAVKNADHLYFYDNTNKSITSIRTSNKLDVSNYKKVGILCTYSGGHTEDSCAISLQSSYTEATSPAIIASFREQNSNKFIKYLDISNVNGNYYVTLSSCSNYKAYPSDFKVYQIWLER